jgi:hypothetical protein
MDGGGGGLAFNPYPKPPPSQKSKGGGLKRVKALEGGKPLRQVSEKRARRLAAEGLPLTTFGRRNPKDRLQKRMRWHRSTTAWKQPRRLSADSSPKLRKALKKIGRRGRRLLPGDREWSATVRAYWGSCILTGETGEGFWPVDPHHCYDKSTDGALRHNPANGILLRRDLHTMADEYPELHQACQRVADERLSFAQGHRDRDVSRREARSLILQMAPKVRKYMRAEESA